MLSISFTNILVISFYYSLLVSCFVLLVMYSLEFLMNHVMGMGFSSSTNDMMDSFVMWPITFIVMSYILPGFEPLVMFSYEEGYMDLLNMSGQQWFWSYSSKESIMSWDENNLQSTYSDGLFLLYSSTPCFLSLYQPMMLIGDSVDVIHSWGVSGLGMKFDLIPGHMTLETFLPVLSGIFMGNCFEMCGAYHSFMTMNMIMI